MKFIAPLALAISLTCPLGVTAGLAQPRFPELTGRVVDQADLLSPAAETDLTRRLEALERDTTHQLVVVTLRDLQNHAIEDYGYRLGRAWGIGQADANNGALLIVAPNQRKVRIEVGYGLEPVLTDGLSALIIENRILPAFREGDFEGGVEEGVEAIDAQLRLDPEEAQARAAEARQPRSEGPAVAGILTAAILFLFFTALIVGAASGGRRRRRNGVAPILLWAASEAMRSGARRGGGGVERFGGFGGGGGSFGGGGASGGW